MIVELSAVGARIGWWTRKALPAASGAVVAHMENKCLKSDDGRASRSILLKVPWRKISCAA